MHTILSRAIIITLISIAMPIGVIAQETTADSTKSASGDSNRNVLMNADFASQPRQISLGLPISGYAYIYES